MPTTTAGILQFSQPIYKITESGEWLTEQVQVLRKDGATGNVSVKVTAKTESATVSKNIEKISQVLTWTDGDITPKFVNIKPIQDMHSEGDEFLTLSLSSIKGAKYVPVNTAQLVIYDRALPVTVLQPSAINDSHIISIYNPVPGNNTGIKFGDFKNWLCQEIMASLPTTTNLTSIPNVFGKSYQLNMATMLANGLRILANNVTTGIDSLGEYLSFSKRSSSLIIKGIEENFNSDFAIEIKLAIDSQYSNIMGIEPDGLLNLRLDGSNWCFDVSVGQNNVITIPNAVSGELTLDTIRIIRSNNVITLDVNGVLVSKSVTQIYNTGDGLVIGNFQSFNGKLYGLKIFTW